MLCTNVVSGCLVLASCRPHTGHTRQLMGIPQLSRALVRSGLLHSTPLHSTPLHSTDNSSSTDTGPSLSPSSAGRLATIGPHAAWPT
ncbi:unnamed protein product [Protopolystoma xenopodis]|uniref:Uncharacterized protein n=1 Tax=Protopolystoma xenopodis TaxID=117903 RepID=A0A3S5B3U9_9PLAT|nr:unnamed protein product [Protopolystoma xenopodis]